MDSLGKLQITISFKRTHAVDMTTTNVQSKHEKCGPNKRSVLNSCSAGKFVQGTHADNVC